MPANSLRVGIVMDPIESIKPVNDSSFAMLLEATRRGAELHYLLQQDLKLRLPLPAPFREPVLWISI